MNTIKLFLPLAMAAILTGCATTVGQPGPTLQEVRDTACPVVVGVVMGLQVEPSLSDKTRERLAQALPGIEVACAATGTIEDLRALTQVAFPPLLALIAESELKPEAKQAAIIGLTTVKIAILSYRPPVN